MPSHAESPRPDFVVLLTDQERAPPPYEPQSLATWRKRALSARRWFDDNGVRFQRHYAGATACTPSRPTLLTGHYPAVHGVSQTTGFAKKADDPRMRWLRPGEVPTLGHWLRLVGYDTHYDGKWHVSDADLRDPRTGHPLATNTPDGKVIEDAVRAYRNADPLESFGFSGWVGPEPHGARRSNSGLVRDPLTAERVVQWLDDRNRRRRAGDRAALAPFMLVVSFVNPHDIVFWPLWALRSALGPDPRDRPRVPEAPTQFEDLIDKPATQAAYRDAYFGIYGPSRLIRAAYERFSERYRETYLRLHKEVDRHIDRVRRAVLDGPHADRTILFFSSDHGELLGAHGGLHQKWMNLYDEAVRVPFVVAHTGAYGPVGRVVTQEPTSHVDLLPTLLGFVGANPEAIAQRLRATHSEVHPLPGKDLSGVVRGRVSPDPNRRIYMTTNDHVTEGSDERNMGARLRGVRRARGLALMSYQAHVATNLEGLVGRANGPRGPALYKLVWTYDDPSTWTEPGVRTLSRRDPLGRSYRTEKIPDVFELYDLDANPTEDDNLASSPEHHEVLASLTAELRGLCDGLPARNEPWPYAGAIGSSAAPAPPREQQLVTRKQQVHAIVRAPQDDLWAILADFGSLARWFSDATHSSLLSNRSAGLGARRRVQLKTTTLIETVVEWQAPRYLSYTLEGLPPVIRKAENRWMLTAMGQSTHVRIETRVALDSGLGPALLHHAVLSPILDRAATRLLADLSKTVESS